MAARRNSHDNDLEHHLYGIMDSIDDDVVKYGISSDQIGIDDLSDRLRRQLNLFNAVVGWARFYGRIILKGIKGRKKAEEIEDDYIKEYEKRNGRKPRANRK
ncbi:MAG: hypothetical protein AAGJ18_14610 [Bacteroidota bacterium]